MGKVVYVFKCPDVPGVKPFWMDRFMYSVDTKTFNGINSSVVGLKLLGSSVLSFYELG